MDKSPAVPSKSLRMSYRLGRGEQGVLTFEPYKSVLLPHWRFRTAPIARESSAQLWEKFLEYDAEDDFVGMATVGYDAKIHPNGMTRAKRYSNHKGGRKYDAEGKEKAKVDHEGKAEKEEASRIFREVWEKCKVHEGYSEKKRRFIEEQKDWERSQALGEKEVQVNEGTGKPDRKRKATKAN